MIYNYSSLWKTLNERGITRKQLREILQLSPATMARISANEPIATETLGRICDYLQCNLDKIFTIEPQKEKADRWYTLNNSKDNQNSNTYRIFLYFFLDTDNEAPAEYLYGYATPFSIDEERMNIWQCSYGKNTYKQFCIIDGALYTNDLRRFLDAALNKYSIADIFKLINAKFPDKTIKSKDIGKINNAKIANGSLVYRPPFIQPAETSCLDMLPEYKPLLSFAEDSTLCESLHGTNKRQYYTSGNGIDAKKTKLIWHYFSENLPLHHNLNEVARLGNFEIITSLHNAGQRPVQCGIWRDAENEHGAKISISKKLTGKYILRVRLYNSRNPIWDNTYTVYPQNADENPLYISLKEDFFFSEIELWSTVGTDNTEQRLIYQTSTPYVRQIGLNISVMERNIALEDRWSLAMRKQGKPVNTQVTFFSNCDQKPISGRQEQVWLTEERNIQKVFYALLGNSRQIHDDDAFFARGTDKIVEFIYWLEKCIQKHPQAKRIILFDPYINDTAIIKFIRSIKSINIDYEIITDSFPSGRKIRKEEINTIKALASTLPYIASSCKLRVRSFTRASGTLHDRILIIADSVETIMYVLSTSLDSMAKQHSSIINAVKPSVAAEIFDSYVQLVKDAEQKNMIETLYDSTNNANTAKSAFTQAIKTETDDTHNQHDAHYTKEYFINAYGTANTKTALNCLAFMYYDEVNQCIEYILNLDKETEIQRLQTILNDIKENEITVRNNLGLYVLNQNTLVKKEFDLSGSLLEAAKNAIGWCFEYGNTLPYEYAYAIKILWRLSPESYIHFLEELVQTQNTESEAEPVNAKPTPQATLIYAMVVHITKILSFPKEEDIHVLRALAKSRIAYLRTLYAAKLIWLPEPFLNALRNKEKTDYENLKQILQEKCATICDTLTPTEACVTLIQLIVNLQIAALQYTHQKELLESFTDLIIEAYIKTQLINKKSDTNCLIQQLAPLNWRNPYNICQIAEVLHIAKYINAEQHYEILLHFWKLVYIKENGKEKDYYNEETIQRSNLLADRILKTGNMYAEKLLKEISKRSRNLYSRLYDPLLYSKNYTSWKLSVDQLASLFVTERYLISKNPAFSFSKSETEFIKLTQNYEEILNDYSATYRIWKKELTACAV